MLGLKFCFIPKPCGLILPLTDKPRKTARAANTI